MRNKRSIFIVATFFFVLFTFFGNPIENSTVQRTFTAAICSDIPNLHPHIAYNADEAQVLTALYEGLFVYDPYTLEPVPGLAESWEVSEDGLEWTFTLRKNLVFENGDPITAGTFRDSFLNLLNPALQLPYASLLDYVKGAQAYRNGKNTKSDSIGITALSNIELRISLITPAEHLPNILCHHAFSAVHPSQLQDAARFIQINTFENAGAAFHPIANGPFKIESFSNNKLKLTKNPLYWDAVSVSVPKIDLLLKGDPKENAEVFNRGGIDWISDNPELNTIAAMHTVTITPMFATEFFYFNTDNAPLNNPTMRQALLTAIPYDELRKGYLIPAKTLIFPLAGYPTAKEIADYDVKKAKKLLKKAKKTLKEIKPVTILLPETEYYKKQAALLKDAWEKIEVTVKIVTVPFSLYYAELKKQDYHLGLISWIADFADPLAFLELFRPSSSLNNTAWKNDTYEALIKKAVGEHDRKKRFKELSKAEQILLNDAVIIPLSHVPAINVIDLNEIKGWYSNAVNIHPFKFIHFIEPKALPGVALGTQIN